MQNLQTCLAACALGECTLTQPVHCAGRASPNFVWQRDGRTSHGSAWHVCCSRPPSCGCSETSSPLRGLPAPARHPHVCAKCCHYASLPCSPQQLERARAPGENLSPPPPLPPPSASAWPPTRFQTLVSQLDFCSPSCGSPNTSRPLVGFQSQSGIPTSAPNVAIMPASLAALNNWSVPGPQVKIPPPPSPLPLPLHGPLPDFKLSSLSWTFARPAVVAPTLAGPLWAPSPSWASPHVAIKPASLAALNNWSVPGPGEGPPPPPPPASPPLPLSRSTQPYQIHPQTAKFLPISRLGILTAAPNVAIVPASPAAHHNRSVPGLHVKHVSTPPPPSPFPWPPTRF